jgi:hypothetical protein
MPKNNQNDTDLSFSPDDDDIDPAYSEGKVEQEQDHEQRQRKGRQETSVPPKNTMTRWMKPKVLIPALVLFGAMGTAFNYMSNSLSGQPAAMAVMGRPEFQAPGRPQSQPYSAPQQQVLSGPQDFQQPVSPVHSGNMENNGFPPPPPAANPPSLLSTRVDAIDARLASLEQKLQADPHAEQTTKNNDEGLQLALQRLTAELQKATAGLQEAEKEKGILQAENAELTKKLKDTERDLAKAERRLAEKLETSKTTKKKRIEEREIVEHGDAEKNTSKPKVIALFGNGAVLQDETGKTMTLEIGQAFHGYRIEAVDFQKGTVQTSKGVLRYGVN